MKCLLFAVVSILLLQFTTAQGGGVTSKKCEDFLPQQTCENLRKVATLLHEKASTIQDAVQAAIAQHKTKASEMLTFIKEYLAENMQCDKVLGADRCAFLTNLASKFHVKALALKETVVEAVVSGAKNAKQIYDKVVGGLVEKAKNLKCEDLIAKATCDILDAFAKNVNLKVADVTEAVKLAISSGLDQTKAIITFVRGYLTEKLSCDTFLGEKWCDRLESLAKSLNVNFNKVIEKLKELYASGVDGAAKLYGKVVAYIWKLWSGGVAKRDADGSLKDKIREKILALVEKVITVSSATRARLEAEIKKLIADGKVTFGKIKKYVADLIAKYGPKLADEVAMDDVHKSLIEKFKDALKKAHGKAKVVITELLAKTKDQLEKIKEYVKQILNNQGQYDEGFDATHDILTEMAYKTIDDEAQSAEEKIMEMIYEEL